MGTTPRAPRRRNRVTLAHASQIKTRERVRDLAEVYTHKREVDAMLDLVADMFPSEKDPGNTDRKFLEPAAGSGNFLEEILRRKLTFVRAYRYRQIPVYEHRILRALASIYAIDIDPDNVQECKDRLRAVINSHLDNDLNTRVATEGFASAVDVILETSIICADTLKDAHAIYQFWSFERASLLYASEDRERYEQIDRYRVGLWERSVDQDELPDMSAAALG